MLKSCSEKSREEVVQAQRNRGSGVTLEKVAADFDGHVMTLSRWTRRADVKRRGTRNDHAEEHGGLELGDCHLILVHQMRRYAEYI